MADDKNKEGADKETKNATGDKLIAAGCKAFGIDEKNVFSSRYDGATKTAIIVTNGGSKVKYQEGDKPALLSQIAVTGINPEWAKRKVIAGKAK